MDLSLDRSDSDVRDESRSGRDDLWCDDLSFEEVELLSCLRLELSWLCKYKS